MAVQTSITMSDTIFLPSQNWSCIDPNISPLAKKRKFETTIEKSTLKGTGGHKCIFFNDFWSELFTKNQELKLAHIHPNELQLTLYNPNPKGDNFLFGL